MARYCDRCTARPATRGVHPFALTTLPEIDPRLRVCVECDHDLVDAARALAS